MPTVSMDEIHSNLKNEGGDDNNIKSLNLLEFVRRTKIFNIGINNSVIK